MFGRWVNMISRNNNCQDCRDCLVDKIQRLTVKLSKTEKRLMQAQAKIKELTE